MEIRRNGTIVGAILPLRIRLPHADTPEFIKPQRTIHDALLTHIADLVEIGISEDQCPRWRIVGDAPDHILIAKDLREGYMSCGAGRWHLEISPGIGG